jgi:hypothetical protein
MHEQHHSAFEHLTVPNAALYRRIMATFVVAKRRFAVHLRPEDVHEALGSDPPTDLATVAAALVRLEEWDNLRSDADTSRVTTVEDFHRARRLYQLTRRGEAVEEALAACDAALGRRGALQAVALTDIATQLRALLELAGAPAADPAKVHLLLRGLVDRFTDLAANAQAFMASLQRTINLHDADPDTFLAYKDRLIDYLERFVADLVTTGAEVAGLVGAVEQAGVDRLLDEVAWREAADAAPGAGDGEDPRQAEFGCGRLVWRERWLGFRAWFVSGPGTPARPGCCARRPGPRCRGCSRSSPRSTSGAPAGRTGPRTSGRSPGGSRRRPTTAPGTCCGGPPSGWLRRATSPSTPPPWPPGPSARWARARHGPPPRRWRSVPGCVGPAATSAAAGPTRSSTGPPAAGCWPSAPPGRPSRWPRPERRWPPPGRPGSATSACSTRPRSGCSWRCSGTR